MLDTLLDQVVQLVRHRRHDVLKSGYEELAPWARNGPLHCTSCSTGRSVSPCTTASAASVTLCISLAVTMVAV